MGPALCVCLASTARIVQLPVPAVPEAMAPVTARLVPATALQGSGAASVPTPAPAPPPTPAPTTVSVLLPLVSANVTRLPYLVIGLARYVNDAIRNTIVTIVPLRAHWA